MIKRPKDHNMMKEKFSPIDIAEDVLKEALKQITTKADQHGDTEASFTMIGQMWSIYIQHAAVIRGQTEVDSSDVAQMMAIVKLVRSLYGNGKDNYVDGAGYTALSAMMQTKESLNG